MKTRALDPHRVERFSRRLTNMLNGGALALMMSIGHRTGLFDTLALLPPADSALIAREAGLNERYVREWLAAMVTGGIVEYDARHDRYTLPAEHAALLTRDARPSNVAATAQWIPLLASVEDEVVNCFERGGGVPYAFYRRFHAVMAEESEQSVVAVLNDAILPAVPGLVAALEQGVDVLDVGCGSGRALHAMAYAFPKSRFTGYDASAEAIATARRDARALGLSNVWFQARDVARIERIDAYDLITAFDAIHDQARPEEVLARIFLSLRTGGVFLMQDIAGTSHVEQDAKHPMGPFLYTVSCLHCITVSLAEGGAGLGAMWGSETATRMLREAGFAAVDRMSLPHDAVNEYYVARKQAA
jgi:2-polyprenyl-3-methyl-5-hydroxy-6-metoxy-1,4-benzoquinol methylase